MELNDIAELFKLRSDAGVMRFVDRPLAKSIDEIKVLINKITDSINSNDGITWAISLKDDLKLIGTIGFYEIIKEHYRAEIGYLLSEDHQGKGLMNEALAEVLRFGFKQMKLHSVEANVNPGNLASIKLLEKNKFIREAYFRENFYYDGRFLDSAIYSLLSPG